MKIICNPTTYGGKAKGRWPAYEKALKEATEVPLRICQNANEALKLCPAIRKKGNKNLLSDVDCAISMLQCAYETGLINVKVNLKSAKDKDFIEKTREKLKEMKPLGMTNPSQGSDLQHSSG